jgi:hypothetical protein
MSALTEALARLRQYNSNGYNALTNPHGMGDDGYEDEFPRALNDTATAISTAVDLVDMARAAANQAGSWLPETLPVARLSATQIAIIGPEAAALPYKLRRRLRLIQTTSGIGYVESAVHDAQAGRVVVTVSGVAVDAGLAEVWIGQDPDNAPQSAVGGSFSILQKINFNGF